MKMRIVKALCVSAAAMVVVFGCSTSLQSTGGDSTATPAGSPSGTISSSSIDSEFSVAPVSPGGTGGVIVDGINEEGEAVGEATRSFFEAFQIDPTAEDTAGPKFVVAGDINQDGLLDLVSAWNQSQPIQLHLQQRDANNNLTFRTVTIAGSTPIAVVAGLELGQINDDGFLDIVVLVKATGLVALCPPVIAGDPPSVVSNLEGQIIVMFNPGVASQIPDGDTWQEMILVNPFVQDPWIHNQFPGNQEADFETSKTQPEIAGFTSLVVAEIDGVAGDDIIVALNPGDCETLGQRPPTTTVDLWTNPGPGLSTNSALWGAPPPSGQSRNVPITLIGDAPQVKDIEALDVDGDGDLDVVATFTNSISLNVRWTRNPFVPHTTGGVGGTAEVIRGSDDGWRFFASGWQVRPIGQIDTAADVMTIGDIDQDGFDDIVVRSTAGQLVQWFRRPNALTIEPEFPPNDPVPDRFNFPWPVFTLTEFSGQSPEAIALGDVTGDGQLDLMVAAEGAVFWYDSTTNGSVFDPWASNTIIQDSPATNTPGTQAGTTPTTGTAPTAGAGVGVSAVDVDTNINSLLIVDLDADGRMDIIGTLDRRSGTGLSDDRLVWYRNIREEAPAAP